MGDEDVYWIVWNRGKDSCKYVGDIWPVIAVSDWAERLDAETMESVCDGETPVAVTDTKGVTRRFVLETSVRVDAWELEE